LRRLINWITPTRRLICALRWLQLNTALLPVVAIVAVEGVSGVVIFDRWAVGRSRCATVVWPGLTTIVTGILGPVMSWRRLACKKAGSVTRRKATTTTTAGINT